MSDEKAIEAIATLWVDNGGDSEGIEWCWKKIKDKVNEIIKQREGE